MNYPSQIVKLPEEAYEGAIKKYAREGAYIAGTTPRIHGYRSAKPRRSSISASTYGPIR